MKRFIVMLCLLGISDAGLAMSEEKMSEEVRQTSEVEEMYKKLIGNPSLWGPVTETTNNYENGMTEIIKVHKKGRHYLISATYIYNDNPPFIVIKENSKIIDHATVEGDDIDIDDVITTMLEAIDVYNNQPSPASSSNVAPTTASSSSSSSSASAAVAAPNNQIKDESEEEEPGAYVPTPPSDCGCITSKAQ